LASRMEQMAKPGSVLLTAGTLKLAQGYVQFNRLGPVNVKGLSEPIDVYEVSGAGAARSRLHAAAARGLTRFIGRSDEVERLGKALAQARNGRGQIVAVVGEPGVGKSRLFYEFVHSHGTQGWLVLESGSVSYGKATPYLPVIDLLKTYFQIDSRDDARKIRERVTGKLLALDEALKPAIPVILTLLDVAVDDPQWQALDPSQRRQRIFDVIKRIQLRESQLQPLVIVIEDLHWIDSETQAVLDSLVDCLPTARILLLVNYRPEYRHNWGSKTFYTQLRLDSLPPESAEELLHWLLGTDASVQPLRELLITRTEGNPFFLEESVQSLVETRVLVGERGTYRLEKGAESTHVPATVQAVLAARIDRLSSEDKRLLQSAAVIGKDVSLVLVQAIADVDEEAVRRGLMNLQTTEFLYEMSLFPDLEFTFKHALTHEIAYGSLLQDRRRMLHARIVEAVEKLYADRLAEHVERLAHHAFRGELREKAVHYLRQAGLKAAGMSALQDARGWFEQALEVLDALSESPSTLEQAFDIRLDLRPVLFQLGEIRRVLGRLREAETLAERLSDDRRRGLVYAFGTSHHTTLGELDEALVTGTRALQIAERLVDLKLRILTTSYLEQAHYHRGDYERVVELATDNLAVLPVEWLYEYLGASAPASVYDRHWLVMSFAQLGRFAEAAEYEAQAIRLAVPTEHAFTIGQAHRAAGTLHLLKGDWTKALSLFEQGIAVAREGNVVIQLPYAVASSAWALAQLGETTEALDRLRKGEQLVDRYAAREIVSNLSWAYHALGRTCLLLSQLNEAQSLADHAVESSAGHQGFMAHALHLLGDIATHPNRFDAEPGEAYYHKALALAEPRGMRPLIAHCHLGLGKLYRRTGKQKQTKEHLNTATTLFREMEMEFWLEKAESELKDPR
jgi:tetratricopeptide (TPR) repeat protein